MDFYLNFCIHKNIFRHLDVTKEINDFKNKFTDRTCYSERSKLISEDFFNDYFLFLDNGINNLFFKNKNNSLIIPCISLDGTKSIAYYSSKNKFTNKKIKMILLHF